MGEVAGHSIEGDPGTSLCCVKSVPRLLLQLIAMTGQN